MAYYLSPATYEQVAPDIIRTMLKVLEIREPLPVPDFKDNLSRTEALVRAVLSYIENSRDGDPRIREAAMTVGVGKRMGHVVILPTSRRANARMNTRHAFNAALAEQYIERDQRRLEHTKRPREFEQVLAMIEQIATAPPEDQEGGATYGLLPEDIPVLERRAAALGLGIEVEEWINETSALVRIFGPRYARENPNGPDHGPAY